MRRRLRFPTLVSLVGTALLLAGVYGAVPAALGMSGVPVLLVGGVWALRRSGVDRKALGRTEAQIFPGGAFSAPPPEIHHHGGHGDSGGGLF